MAGNSALSRTTSACSFGWDSGTGKNGRESVTQRFCAVQACVRARRECLPDNGLSLFNLIRFQHYDHHKRWLRCRPGEEPGRARVQARDQGGVELGTTFAPLRDAIGTRANPRAPQKGVIGPVDPVWSGLKL
jgi:hypothetical protein